MRAVALGLKKDATYNTLLWSMQVVVLFFGCGRGAEVTSADHEKYTNPKKDMLRESTTRSKLGIKIYLPYQKASPLYAGSFYYFVEQDTGPEVFRLVDLFLKTRDTLFGPTGPLFLNYSGVVPPRRSFVTLLKKNLGKHCTGHSGCSGGRGTWYILMGASDKIVQHQGRWSSSAWEDYLRIQPELAMAIRVRDIIIANRSLDASTRAKSSRNFKTLASRSPNFKDPLAVLFQHLSTHSSHTHTFPVSASLLPTLLHSKIQNHHSAIKNPRKIQSDFILRMISFRPFLISSNFVLFPISSSNLVAISATRANVEKSLLVVSIEGRGSAEGCG